MSRSALKRSTESNSRRMFKLKKLLLQQRFLLYLQKKKGSQDKNRINRQNAENRLTKETGYATMITNLDRGAVCNQYRRAQNPAGEARRERGGRRKRFSGGRALGSAE